MFAPQKLTVTKSRNDVGHLCSSHRRLCKVSPQKSTAGLTVGHYDTYCVFKCSFFYSHQQTNAWLFFQSATLLSGQEQPEPKASSSDDSSSSDEEDEQRMDLSSTTK